MTTAADYEKLGVFYLGRERSSPEERSASADAPAGAEAQQRPLLYDSKDLTTHAVIVGMTGSGKTGLGVVLLEEAAIDGIPAIVIDPKGDMPNLALRFPQLRGEDFAPWVEAGEAARAGKTPDELAQATATKWKEGIAQWDQAPDRIERLKNACDVVVYTPGSDAGVPLTVLRSLAAPPKEALASADDFRDRVSSTTASLLGLLGVEADPLTSREHIFLASVIDAAWRSGRDLDLPRLIREIQQPPFDRLGAMDLESVYPTADRATLAMTLNNLLASPGFSGWMHGEPLSIQRLLYSPEGKPQLAVVSIAHLSDRERMFFVTILLGELVSWMRTQSGTSSLRAILYMDEVFGYLPPTANPPSKLPMLTLLKQARAYGLGLVLATQNPVDLDYKALSNAGTWFLGRLQTERDKLRVLDGLESAAAGAAFDRKQIDRILSGLPQRTFVMNNVHEEGPALFQVRWALSYLRGPLTRDQIAMLSAERKEATAEDGNALPATMTETSVMAASVIDSAPIGAHASAPAASPPGETGEPPILPPGVTQQFVRPVRPISDGQSVAYRPALLFRGKLHFLDAKKGVDLWQERTLVLPISTDFDSPDFDEGQAVEPSALTLDDSPLGHARFEELPSGFGNKRKLTSWRTAFRNRLYETERLSLWFCPDLKLWSKPGETEGEFRVALQQQAREARDAAVDKLRAKYKSKLETASDRVARLGQRVEVEKQQANTATFSAFATAASSVLGAFLGRKVVSQTSLSKASTGMKSAARAWDQRSDIGRAESTLEEAKEDLAALEKELEADLIALKEKYDAEALTIDPAEISPRKSDLDAADPQIVWLPHVSTGTGFAEPAWRKD
ncbi:MAG TPA: DUF87 domain-containing protein [Pirellulaceae bacterium]|jgi:hypothetical protein|nr:DUF87 domain-containing protein [Pirellulaceae bacterium]